MAIDKEKLIELLIARTGLEKEKVEEQLSQLIGRIKQAAGEGKSFQIEGLGTFDLSNDTLHFNPADTLETEINHKYAGMKPIELIGAFKETPPPAGEVEEKETEEKESGPEQDYYTEEPVSAEPKEKTAGEPEIALQNQLQEVFGGGEDTTKNQGSDDSSEPQEELLTPAGSEEPGEEVSSGKASFVFDAESAVEEQEPEQETSPAAQDTSRISKKKKDKDPIGTVLTVCVAILAIGVAGWLAYDLGLLNALKPAKQTDNQKDPAVQSASGQPASSVSFESETGPDESEQESANQVTGNDTGSQFSVSDYGLMGKTTSRGNNGYTIVIHSLANENTSRAIKGRLESEGYRTILTSAVVNGRVFWRVGLGQFRTIADAKKAARTLPEQYQNNHFIKRIQ